MKEYSTFLESKRIVDAPTGIRDIVELSPHLFEFQRDIVRWALRRGRAAIFADCGMGKTLMQLEWARHIPGRVLIVAPLAVAEQTVREGEKFGIPVVYRRKESPDDRITVTNYEMLGSFDPSAYTGVVLDESSILKSYDGKTRSEIIDAFRETPYRLACTATPAPNDYMELGNHAEFLGIVTYSEMLSLFFVHDGGETQKWRVKGHAIDDFWRWLCSWAVMIRKPSDLGYDDNGFVLPPLRFHDTTIASNSPLVATAKTLDERRKARRDSLSDRVARTADLINGTPGPWIVWCNLNMESEELVKSINGAVEVRGSDAREDKARAMLDFADGKIRVLVTKPLIAGFGMNWQHCSQVAFVGLSDSYEQFYQAVRRCWRFGQEKPVDVHVVSAEAEGAVVENIRRKEADAQKMAQAMVRHMSVLSTSEIHEASRERAVYEKETRVGDGWAMNLGDCVDVLRGFQNSILDYSIFSPPFASLYTYSNSDRDMGNSRTHEEFFEHFRYAVREIYRATKPGRLVSFHCMNLPTSKIRHGVIGLKDFRGDLIRLFQSEGWIYHSEVVIWKNPVLAMQRTKALGLLHKQLKKDSSLSRQGIPDYLVTMRKPGENKERVTHTNDDFPVSLWQRYASPVWMDINPSDTLQHRSVREHADEKHICPLQLEVIRRALDLWTNPGDLVLSPFAGIGSEGVIAREMGRRFYGIELKRSYFEQAVRNLSAAREIKQPPKQRAETVGGWEEGFGAARQAPVVPPGRWF